MLKIYKKLLQKIYNLYIISLHNNKQSKELFIMSAEKEKCSFIGISVFTIKTTNKWILQTTYMNR
jgi:hypothetical protein